MAVINVRVRKEQMQIIFKRRRKRTCRDIVLTELADISDAHAQSSIISLHDARRDR